MITIKVVCAELECTDDNRPMQNTKYKNTKIQKYKNTKERKGGLAQERDGTQSREDGDGRVGPWQGLL